MGLSSLFRRLRGSRDPGPAADDEPQVRRNEGHRIAIGGTTMMVCQAQHLGMRRQQQDSFGFSSPDSQPFTAIVADGMGGMRNGAEASRMTVRLFLDAVSTGRSMADAAREANQAVYAMGVEAGEPESTGSTLAAVTIAEGGLSWVAVGDSQIYRFRNGELALVNEEHSYSADLLDLVLDGRLNLDQVRQDPQKDALTSFIGRETLTLIDECRMPVPLAAGDVVLICSDGLYRVVGTDEIREVLASGADNPAEVLLRRAIARNHPHQDNITILTLSIESLS